MDIGGRGSKWPGIVAGLVLALAVAGCAAPSDTIDLPEVAPDSWVFEGPLAVAPIRNAQSESFIEVSSDGQTALTCLHGEFKEPSLMYATTDGGASWRELEAFPTPVTGGDCEVALSPDGTWSFVHTQAAGITITTTTDQGQTWTVNPLSGPPVASFSDRAWIEAAGDALVLSYSGYLGITARISQDRALTWSEPQVVAPAAPGLLPLSGHLSVGFDGASILQPYLHVPVDHREATPTQVVGGVAVSRDLGTTWQHHDLPAMTALPLHPAAALAADGSVWYSAYLPNGTAFDFVVWSSHDDGLTWDGPTEVLTGLSSPYRAWAAGRADGRLDFLVQAQAASLGGIGDNSSVAVVRFDPGTNAVQAKVLAEAHEEFVCVTHDGSGRAWAVFTDGGGSLVDGPNPGATLYFVRESAPS